MTTNELQELKNKQQSFFRSNATLPIAFRLQKLKALKKAIEQNEQKITDALYADFKKPEWETWVSEIGFVYAELDHFLKHLKKWARPQRIPTPLTLQPGSTKIYRQPLGRSFVIAPWNYPFQLVIEPLIASIAAGNTVLVKPSEFTPHTSQVLDEILASVFEPEHVALIQGDGAEVFQHVMEHYEPQHIFFTGSTAVGSIVAQEAAKKLIPVVLELGGKSPAIIDGSTPMQTTVRRIIFGKFINGGQTFVAPDYILIHEDHLEKFISVFKQEIERSYGVDPLASEHLASLIHERAFERLTGFLRDEKNRIVIGGKSDASINKLEPTFLVGIGADHPLMKEEIFGPVLPVITYRKEDEIVEMVQKNPDPLSAYIFTKNRSFEKRMIRDLSFGSGVINNTVIHFANKHMPFGGIRTSGHGYYHGKYGFETFTHAKGVVRSGMWFDPKFKYAPYSGRSLRLIRWLFKF